MVNKLYKRTSWLKYKNTKKREPMFWSQRMFEKGQHLIADPIARKVPNVPPDCNIVDPSSLISFLPLKPPLNRTHFTRMPTIVNRILVHDYPNRLDHAINHLKYCLHTELGMGPNCKSHDTYNHYCILWKLLARLQILVRFENWEVHWKAESRKPCSHTTLRTS